MRAKEFTQIVEEGSKQISIKVKKGRNKFATELSVDEKPAGIYQYDANSGRSIAEVYPEYKGKGFGKILVLHAIYTAAQLGMNFIEDESRTAEYDNVLDSLDSNGLAVNDDGYWYVTGEGEQFLKQSLKQGVAEKKSFTTEYKVDNREGLGAVPNNQDVDYFGIRVMMKPSTFLKLALPLDSPVSVDHIVQHLKNGGSLGAPFLDVSIPEEWEDGDTSKPAIISGHEGRNRMLAIQKVEGDNPVEVHLFFRGGLRARHIKPEFIKAMRSGMINQQRTKFIDGDLFL